MTRRAIVDLQAFRVQNYKRVEDTGWISCGDLTVVVGKNEAGKSAILRGLSKINPSDDEEYDGLREFPRRRFTDEFDSQDWPVASVRFRLDQADIADLVKISDDLADVATVVVTRYYSGERTVGFEPAPTPLRVRHAEAVKAADSARRQLADARAPEGHGEQLGALKPQIEAAIQQAVANLPSQGDLPAQHTDALVQAVNQFMNEGWHDAALDTVLGPLRDLADRNRVRVQHATARSWVVQNMPQFVYFDRYDVLDSAIHIPTFINQLNSTPSAPRVRTTHCLFRHVGLDVAKLHQLGSHQPGTPESDQVRRQLDERSIRASSASQAMTRKFAQWWEQRRHAFRYQVDGDYLRIWVSDDLDPSEIELDQRSQGMQYFFSFFLVFLVEAEDAHANSILLLDEPGTSLHGTAQARIVDFLHKLSKDNQVLYTTHSPFMIDAEHLETVRPVYEDPATGSTKVSDDVWPKDKDALFPLQAALGYQLVQSMFLSKRQVLIEGITDYWIFKAVDHALQATGRSGLDPSIILTPGGGGWGHP